MKKSTTTDNSSAPTKTPTSTTGRKRRTRVPDKPHYPLNLWSIMKNCIGKELSKIPMPVNFSEPLSMLQRLTEDYEYADILDRVRCHFFLLQFLCCNILFFFQTAFASSDAEFKKKK